MADRTFDFQSWFEPYKETFASLARAQQDGLRTLERFARFHYSIAGDLLEAGFAHARAALGARGAVGTQAIAELLQKQAELGAQLSEKFKARAKEFSTLAAEAEEAVSSFAAETTSRATGAKKAA